MTISYVRLGVCNDAGTRSAVEILGERVSEFNSYSVR